MPASRTLALLAALVQTGGRAGSRLPPSRIDVGPSVSSADGLAAPHLHLTAGAHVASGVFKPGLPFDAGAGYLLQHMSSTPGPGEDERAAKSRKFLHGAYVEGAAALLIGPKWSRT